MQHMHMHSCVPMCERRENRNPPQSNQCPWPHYTTGVHVHAVTQGRVEVLWGFGGNVQLLQSDGVIVVGMCNITHYSSFQRKAIRNTTHIFAIPQLLLQHPETERNWVDCLTVKRFWFYRNDMIRSTKTNAIPHSFAGTDVLRKKQHSGNETPVVYPWVVGPSKYIQCTYVSLGWTKEKKNPGVDKLDSKHHYSGVFYFTPQLGFIQFFPLEPVLLWRRGTTKQSYTVDSILVQCSCCRSF